MTRRRNGGREFPGGYFPLAHAWFNTPEFRQLSAMSKNVFIAAAMQYNGGNNGDISLPLSLLREWACTGNRQRCHAIAELVSAGWLIRSRRGGLRMGPDLFALTVKPVDECIDRQTGRSKHELRSGGGLLHLWRGDRAHLREPMQPKPRSDSKSATSIDRVVKMRREAVENAAVEDASTGLRVSAGGGNPALRVSAQTGSKGPRLSSV